MKKLFFLFFLPLITFAQLIDGISVIVEDKIITLYDIQQEMQLSHVSKQQAINILIRKKLEEYAIAKKGIKVSSEEVFNEIQRLALANNMTVSQFYDVVREKNNLTSEELKEKIKERLLAQKLYQSIAFAKMQEPSQEEIQEYFKLHKSQFSKPNFIDVVIYSSNDKNLLEEKRTNPMFFSQKIIQQTQRINTSRIAPALLELLLKTPEGSFTPIVPNPQGGFLMFYIQKKAQQTEVTLEDVRQEVINAIMNEKRAEILDDYFAKLRDSADIKIIRE